MKISPKSSLCLSLIGANVVMIYLAIELEIFFEQINEYNLACYCF